MFVLAFGERKDCSCAVKRNDSITLYDESGNATFAYYGISDFSAFTVEGGEWETPEPTETEQLRADVDFILAMEGLL